MYRYLTNKRLLMLLALFVFISTTFDLVSALSPPCTSVGLCPLPSGLTGSGLENGVVNPWPPAKDTGTSEPCLPFGKDKISFKCDDGFRLQTSKIELFCDLLSDWNLDAPTCVENVPAAGLSSATEAQLPPCAKCSGK
ncbi:uncharacterized protein LOC117108201 [Anneissia japonica]|uniref:uncharacterized protein LOC117108201 n=1 Tax=Anneissia japonica TaxID=1529436 RepID=UPI0014256655|nr:uncharacterized protein LOC117108201 [Anneissia japonica]